MNCLVLALTLSPRGWVWTEGIDDKETECGLDDLDHDCTIDNSDTGDVESILSQMLQIAQG